MDDELVAIIEDQGDEFEQTSGGVCGDHEPAVGVVLIVE